jgi:hypothetical protein
MIENKGIFLEPHLVNTKKEILKRISDNLCVIQERSPVFINSRRFG